MDPLWILVGLIALGIGSLAISYLWERWQANARKQMELEMRMRQIEDGRKPSYNDIAAYEDAMSVILDTQKHMELYNLRLEQARRILGNGRNGDHDHNTPAGNRPEGWDIDVSDSGHRISLRKK